MIDEPVRFSLPDRTMIVAYCNEPLMSPQIIENVVLLFEDILDEPIRHTIRNLFPEPLKKEIKEEIRLGWKAPERRLRLANKLSSENHIEITGGPYLFRNINDQREITGKIRILINSEPPKIKYIASRFAEFADVTHAAFAKLESPIGDKPLSDPLVLQLSPTWKIRESLGWFNFVSEKTASYFPNSLNSNLYFVDKIDSKGWLFGPCKKPYHCENQTHLKSMEALVNDIELPHEC
ncbi:MAG: hypothetical protein K0U68_09720 [Gammaproteobacteria bacterium]|nr:hypothetical protein [Gammaproteobacteria bacterium]